MTAMSFVGSSFVVPANRNCIPIPAIFSFCEKTVLSTKALNIHISVVLHRDAAGPDGRA